AASMAMSFMAGLMDIGGSYAIAQNAPIVALLNPASLITDSFYSLYFGGDMTRYTRDLLLLATLAIIFSLIAYGRLRRQKYASV
ncbi:MAG: ABC transporter permease, partial [Clostridia bacterium]|nr:ABC transporter permease [Clostridia bacterium]